MTIGGMPAVVNTLVTNGNFSGTLKMQRQLLLDYEEDITKYAQGLDKGKIKIDLGDGFLHQGRTVAHTRGGKDN